MWPYARRWAGAVGVAGVVIATCAATPVLAWRALNDLNVNRVSQDVFEVVGQPGSGGPQYWCAAGDFALRFLDATATTRIYVVRGRGAAVTENRRSAVHFSLIAPEGADTTPGLTLSVTRVGENLNTASARSYCWDRKVIDY